MKMITPNLHFSGCCGQAIALYQKAFNATIHELLRYSDADPKDWARKGIEKDLIYHCEMFLGTQRIFLSDEVGANPPPGNTMSIVITFETAADVKNAFSILSDGCTIVTPMKATTYSSCFVSLIDRFGMRWELMTEQTER